MREFQCQSCDKPKANLHSVNSQLFEGVKLTMCQTCIDSKFEPRWMIILSVQSSDDIPDKAKKLITDRKYVGEVIAAVDIV